MLRDTFVDLLIGRIGNPNDTALKSIIINEMVMVQETLLEGGEFLPWFLLSERSTSTFTIGDDRIQVPSDFIGEWEEGSLEVVDTDGTITTPAKDDWDDIKWKETGSGKPKYYDFAGDYFFIRPTPDKAYTARMRYYSRETSLAGVYGDAANVENNWLKYASDWFLGEVGAIIAGQHNQSPKMVQQFVAQANAGKRRLAVKDTGIRETNKERTMGGS